MSDRPALAPQAHAYDLHLHSRRSYDGVMSPRRIVAMARRRGLRGIAVTDHGTIAGGLEARAVAPADLLVIVGSEVYTTVGDIIGLFLTGEIRGRDPLDVIAQIHEQGGVAILPHPLHGHRALTEAVLRAVDGYEVLNARAGRFDLHGAPHDVPWRALAGKATLAASDAHLPWELGRAWTIIGGEPSESNVAAQLRAGRAEPGGGRSHPANFYASQAVKLLKTRDVGMLARLARRAARRMTRRRD